MPRKIMQLKALKAKIHCAPMHEFPAIRREGFAQKLRKCLKCYVVICAKLRAAREAGGAFTAR